jgi:NAD(P)-dependent dehydrogenase (short-subunit alcohol dehydrogenase family)
MNTKTAIITGGTRGIGASMVADFLRQGWNVAYSGTTPESIEASLAALSGKFPADSYAAFRCDIANESDIIALWEGAVKKFGKVDIWVNNAGKGNEREQFNRLPSEAIPSIIDTNIKGLMLATRIAYNNMLVQGSGAIYNMCGLGSDGRMITGLTPYGTSKRAVQYFTEAFSKEVKGGPVIIGTLYPGMVLTNLTLSQLGKDPAKDKQLIKVYNILANEPEEVTPYLVKNMISNTHNGRKISFFKKRQLFTRFLLSPFSRRDVMSKYMKDAHLDSA